MRTSSHAVLLTLTLSAAILCMPAALQAEVVEKGSFVQEIERLRDLAFPAESGKYIHPTAAQRQAFSKLAHALAAGDLASANAEAAALDYEVVRFADAGSGTEILGLREKLVDGRPKRGWGSFFLNLRAQRPALIEVPHIRFELKAAAIGARVFLETRSFGLLINGAHRNANGDGAADVAALDDSIFLEVHRAWTGGKPPRMAVQIHGWSRTSRTIFPPDARIVISSGDGGVNDDAVRFDAAFESQGLPCYAYNTLEPGDARNVRVNGAAAGRDFRSLAATRNKQGRFTRSEGGSFVHIEIELAVRKTQDGVEKSVRAISQAIAGPKG